jgi:hypothetical protein
MVSKTANLCSRLQCLVKKVAFPVAGIPVAGIPVAGIPVAGIPVAGHPDVHYLVLSLHWRKRIF